MSEFIRPKFLGFDHNGAPIWSVFGAAAADFSAWVPIQYDPTSFGREVQPSAVVESLTPHPLTSNTQEIPRLLNADVGGGSALTDDTNDGSKVTIYSYQYNGKDTLDEAETEDASADPIAAYSYEWLNSFNKSYDNACIGVSGARSATDTDYRPYTSLYKSLRTTDAETGYTANDNYAAGALTYANASSTMSLVEGKEFWAEEGMVWWANPILKRAIREMVDDQNRPLFLSYSNPATGVATDTFMGYRVYWTFGARVSATFKMASVGNPLLAFVNTHYATRGNRIPPQSRFIDARINTTALAHTVVHRARQGFVLRVPQAAAILEVNA